MAGIATLLSLLLGVAACAPLSEDPPELTYTCGTDTSLPTETLEYNTRTNCGHGDDPRDTELNLQEPAFPTGEPCITLEAALTFPNENALDTARVNKALADCKGKGPVKLVKTGQNNVFITGHITADSTLLWVDEGVTLYASRDPKNYGGGTPNCGEIGINDSAACSDFITVQGTNPGVIGDGTIDGQGGEPLVGRDYSWWQASYALRTIDGSIGNPTLINTKSSGTPGTTGVLFYRIKLQNSPKFHIKVAGRPGNAGFACNRYGEGFTVWGVTVLTPSSWTNSQGLVLSPYTARNTDGIDPGAGFAATCGLVACNMVSTGDDQMAIKGGHRVEDVIFAHNRFGTGHGMSIGSEVYGDTNNGIGVNRVRVYDLTIDADSRWTGSPGGDAADSNGIRIKSDPSRGGVVQSVSYEDVCIRDVSNAILISTAYNPLFTGTLYPQFKNIDFHNIHDVSCASSTEPIVTMEGFNVGLKAGPITLDNVIVDNFGSPALSSEWADFKLGPGDVNFTPSGLGVTVTDNRTQARAPKACKFPPLPAPKKPDGWVW